MVTAQEAPVLDALTKELSVRLGLKHDAPGSPTTIGYMHGPGGLLAFPGVDPVMFHTVMGPRSLLGQLPAVPSLYMNPTYETLTGVTDETGTEPGAICDPGPVAGALKSCITTAPFGRFKRQTAELELDRIGQRVDRADPMDLMLVGTPLAEGGVFGAAMGGLDTPTDLLTNELSKRLWERNVTFHRLLARQLWIANPANNVGDAYREFAGFESLVSTGYVDAQSGVACPAVDSYISNFNFGRLDVAPAGTNIVRAVTDMWYQVKTRAERSGMMPVRWVMAMREQLFYELSAVWPCSYLTNRCQTTASGNERVFISGDEQIKMRDAMRQGRYLLIDGVQIEVIFDDGIPEDSNTTNANVPSGCFASDIYLLPMSVVGGRSVLFLEYFQYANPAVQDALGKMILGMIEGAFISWPVQTRGCFQIESKIEPRIVLRTPWLASRLQNVVYCPVQHIRDAFPDDPYFSDGGRVSRPGPSLHAHWND